MLTMKQLFEYKEQTSTKDAANLLLLTGPDGFDGTYEEYESMYEYLMSDY